MTQKKLIESKLIRHGLTPCELTLCLLYRGRAIAVIKIAADENFAVTTKDRNTQEKHNTRRTLRVERTFGGNTRAR